jgi:hypothetical protein
MTKRGFIMLVMGFTGAAAMNGYLIRLSSREQVGWLGGVLEALR